MNFPMVCGKEFCTIKMKLANSKTDIFLYIPFITYYFNSHVFLYYVYIDIKFKLILPLSHKNEPSLIKTNLFYEIEGICCDW
jgi:hypothetical protein